MLDYPSSRSRKWAGIGILLIVLAAPVAFETTELEVNGNLMSRTAIVRLSGTNRNPLMVFEAKEGSVECSVRRCRYQNFDTQYWRDDIGVVADIEVDNDGRVARIVVQGATRLSPEYLRTRRIRGLVMAGFLFISGLAMCLQAWRVNRKS